MRTIRKVLENISKTSRMENIFENAERVEHYMKPVKNICRVWRNTPLKEVGKKLTEHEYVLVFQDSGQPCGIISRKEIMEFLFVKKNPVSENSNFIDIANIQADEIMNQNLEKVDSDKSDSEEILKLFVEKDLRIVLVEKNEDLVGVVTVEELLEELHLSNVFFPMSSRSVSKLKLEYEIM